MVSRKGDAGRSMASAAAERDNARMLMKVGMDSVSYTHLRAHETVLDLVCRLLLEKKKKVISNHNAEYNNY